MLESVSHFLELHSAGLGLLVLAGVFAAFVIERYPPVVVGVTGVAVMLLLGFLSVADVRSVFANPAPIAIGGLFVLSGALVRTGAIDAALAILVRHVADKPRLVVAEVFAGTLATAAVVNNTPVVMIMIPVIKKLASVLGTASTRLLIPLSYVAIMGGTLTLVGTSTNLLVDGIARDLGEPAFGIFEISAVGLVSAFSGVLLLLLLGPRLLPDRPSTDIEDDESQMFLSELLVNADGAAVGKKIDQIAALKPDGVKLIALRRDGKIRRSDLGMIMVEAGDRLILAATPHELAALTALKQFEVGVSGIQGGGSADKSQRQEKNTEFYRATITPTHPGIGRPLLEIPMLSKLKIRILGLARPRHLAGPDLRSAKLRAADTLLIAAQPEELRALKENVNIGGISPADARPFRRRKAPIAVAALLGAVTLAAFGVMPLEGLAMIGVAIVLLTRTIDPAEAWSSIDGDLLILIFSMLAIGTGFQNAGSVDLIVNWISPYLQVAPYFVLLLTVYALTSLLTEAVTNNAVAVVLTPIVIGLGQELGIDPRPLLVAVMLAASASFATPIGYQTNTLVYVAADYRFSDFLRIGLPMNFVVGFSACAGIYWFF